MEDTGDWVGLREEDVDGSGGLMVEKMVKGAGIWMKVAGIGDGAVRVVRFH